MSEFEKAKRIVKQMRLSKPAAADQARKAFRGDLANGRPDAALACAQEFGLDNQHITEAAVALFITLIRRARFPDAYRVLKGYNILEAGYEAQEAKLLASRLDQIPADVPLSREDRVAIKKILIRVKKRHSQRINVDNAEKAIALIQEAAAARDADPRIRGRAVILPSQGDVVLAGDLHGNTDNLQALIAKADLDNHPKRILVIQEILHARVITRDERDLSFATILHALKLQARYPGRLYYLLGNHDLGFHLGRDLVKAGKSLNRYLFKGMSFQFDDAHHAIIKEYKRFIGGMPAALMTQNGIFMSHSTPKRPFIESMSLEYFTDTAAELPFSQSKPIVALVNGRDYAAESAEAFADQIGCDHMIVGHTPTPRGLKVPNKRHIIIDSQHANAKYIRFDLDRPYEHDELVEQVKPLFRKVVTAEEIGDLV